MTRSSESSAPSTRLKSERVQEKTRTEAGWELDEEEGVLRFQREFVDSFHALAFAGCSLALATAHHAGVRCLVLRGRHLELVLASPEEAGLTDRERRAAYLLDQLHRRLQPVEEALAR